MTIQKNDLDNRYFQLIYLSQPRDALSDEELTSILRKSQKYNIDNQISGILIVKDKSNFQLIEGSQQEVVRLYEKIKKDDRHKTPVIVYEGFSNHRAVPFLGMGLTIDRREDHLVRKNEFYFNKSEAIKFTALISGKVKELLLSYLE